MQLPIPNNDLSVFRFSFHHFWGYIKSLIVYIKIGLFKFSIYFQEKNPTDRKCIRCVQIDNNKKYLNIHSVRIQSKRDKLLTLALCSPLE